MNVSRQRSLAAAVAAVFVLASLSSATAVDFTTNTTIAASNATYEGQTIVVRGCTLTVQGVHTFGAMTVASNAVVAAATNVTAASLAVMTNSLFRIGGGGTLSVSGSLDVLNTSTVRVECVAVTGQVAGAWQGRGATVSASGATVDATSRIQSDGQGYVSYKGPAGAVATWQGGGHGGRGQNNASVGTYDSYLAPAAPEAAGRSG